MNNFLPRQKLFSTVPRHVFYLSPMGLCTSCALGLTSLTLWKGPSGATFNPSVPASMRPQLVLLHVWTWLESFSGATTCYFPSL